MSWLVHTKQLTEDQSNILTYIQRGYKHKQTKEGNKITKVHITETGPMYRLSDMYNHKGFTHWNKNKKYTGESMSNSNSLGNGYKIYDLIDEQGFIYYEIIHINCLFLLNQKFLFLYQHDQYANKFGLHVIH